MSTRSLQQVLEATGYFPDGQPAPGLQLGAQAQNSRRGRHFSPDAVWRSPSALTVYFKSVQTSPNNEVVSNWRREIWNEGFAPLLWVISPERVDLYNGFGTPTGVGDAQQHLIRTFSNLEASLDDLDTLAGRLSIETGQFWLQSEMVDRKTSVDQKLLSDLAHLERDLVAAGLARPSAQALIGRVVFTQYLIDRQIVSSARLDRLCGHSTLPPILRERAATGLLFNWLADTFNGDMFPSASATTTPKGNYLARVADFLEAVDPVTGQTSFFPYQFDIIPVELISSIYEQFAHATPPSGSRRSTAAVRNGVHYTRLSLVSLVLDEVMDGLSGKESVLDLTCGSGVFLVEALRRLVARRAGNQKPTRELIRSTLYGQVFGVDDSEPAIRVAAFSLYLAALELDPDPHPPSALRFRPLIGNTLLVGDARSIEQSEDGRAVLLTTTGLRQFDIIVGNPPWSFKGRRGTEERRRTRNADIPAQPRGEGLDFLLRASEFSHDRTRFGVILSAMPFFSRSGTGIAAALHVLQLLAPVTLVNLSNLRGWLFATAKMPAVVLFARHRTQRPTQVTVVQIPWSASGAKSHTFEVSPSDIIKLPLAEIEKHPVKLKAAAVGRRKDLLLLESIASSHLSLSERLSTIGAQFRDGLTRGHPSNQTRDARALKGLEILQAEHIKPFYIPENLPRFGQSKAQWPRSRETYRAPLLIVKEMLAGGPRAVVAVSGRDLVFTDGYFGAALPSAQAQSAHLIAAILSSALASWFFVMTASEFGIWKRRLLIRDVELFPMPDLTQAVKSDPGKHLLQIERKLQQRSAIHDSDWATLDDAVFSLYQLDSSDQVVVHDGLVRASWQWQDGQERSGAPADVQSDLSHYATVFMSVIAGWLSVLNERRMRAEIFDLPQYYPLRVVRFVLEDASGNGRVDVVHPGGELTEFLSALGRRLNVKLATALTGQRELRIHGRDEVVIIKPAARRYWLGLCALEDADAVVAESFTGAPA